MAKGGGVFGGFVLCQFRKGTSKKYKEGVAVAPPQGFSSSKSPLVYIKEPIANYFGFDILNRSEEKKIRTRKVTTIIQGKEVIQERRVSMGATGASRAITVKFKKLTNINKKNVASVRIAMPSSHTFGDMLDELLLKPEVAANIAVVISPDGKSTVYGTAYNPKNKAALNK